jgi:hypothetical protein
MSDLAKTGFTETVTALEATVKAARKAGDIAALLPVAADSIAQLESLAATATDPADQKSALSLGIRCELPTVLDEIMAPRAFVQGLA